MTGDIRVAGVIGWPIRHSRSPVLFDHWFERLGVTGRYVPLAVRPEDFAQVYQALPRAGFCGVNVTLPHKEQALALADEASSAAEAIGAANMIHFQDGKIFADNTDGYGFLENLRQGAPQWSATDGPALVLGAGGAARAIVHALLDAGAPEVRIANRTRRRAEALADHFGSALSVIDWEARERSVEEARTIVNTTSLGMPDQPVLAVDLTNASDRTLVTDLVYEPLETPLLRAARMRGLPVVDGLGMLLHQARPAFRAWFGIDPPVDQPLRRAVLHSGSPE